MKDLGSVSKERRKEFLGSFDYVFCDVDGVLWHAQEPIPGSLEAITALQALGKKVIFVSNNSTKTPDTYYEQLRSAGYNLEKSDLIQPPLALIDFLKKRNVTKEISLLGMTPLRTQLEEAGFTVERFHFENPDESSLLYVTACVAPNPKIGAVVADIDVNLTMAKLQKAATYLKDPEVLFLTGGSDQRLCFGQGNIIIGPGAYHNILTDISGRKPHVLAKPSREFGDFINQKVGVKDPKRVLFIGDSVPEDMGFAANCGYQKMLVLCGLTTKDSVDNWTFPEQYKPDYYVPSLKTISDVLVDGN